MSRHATPNAQATEHGSTPCECGDRHAASDHGAESATSALPSMPSDSQQPPHAASHKVAPFDEAELLRRTFWTVPEVAFIARVGTRTVWRLMADPRSGFPTARRVRGRRLFARDEVLAFLHRKAAR